MGHETTGVADAGTGPDGVGVGPRKKLLSSAPRIGPQIRDALEIERTTSIHGCAMPLKIVPVAKTLYVCDYQFGGVQGKTDIYGLFNTISAPSFPHVQLRFCVFAQLGDGLGEVPYFIDIHGPDGKLVHTSGIKQLRFPSRIHIVQMAHEIRGCIFPNPGVYIVELWCDNTWVADTTVSLRVKR